MGSRPRALVVVAAFGFGPLVLAAGCGSTNSGSSATLARIQPTSFATIVPATTTTTLVIATTVPAGVSTESQTYTVVRGDSVFKIANLFDVDPEVLANFNDWPEGIQHPIFVGDLVNIPPGAAIPGATLPDGIPVIPTTTGRSCTHTIVAGENPTRVARKYELTFDQLQAANPGMDFTTTFVVGDVLTIPPPGTCD